MLKFYDFVVGQFVLLVIGVDCVYQGCVGYVVEDCVVVVGYGMILLVMVWDDYEVIFVLMQLLIIDFGIFFVIEDEIEL